MRLNAIERTIHCYLANDKIDKPTSHSNSHRSVWLHERLDVVWAKLFTCCWLVVELALEFDPMKTESMQEALQYVHSKKHTTRDAEPNCEQEVQSNTIHREVHLQTHGQCLLEEHQGQLLMSKRQSPNTKVRRGMRHGSQDEFNSLD